MLKLDISEEDVIRMYFEESMTQQQIADYYGVSRSCIILRLSPKRREYIKEYMKGYRHLDKYKLSKKKWQSSDEGQASARKTMNKYYQTDRGKEKIKALVKKYQKEHKEEINIYNQTGLQGLRNKIRHRDWCNLQYQWLK